MDDLPGQLKHYRTQYITQTLWADLYDRTDSHGHGHIAVHLKQHVPGEASQEFKTDLDRLEAVAKKAAEFAAGSEIKRSERIGDYNVFLVRWPKQDEPDQVGIQLQETKGAIHQEFVIDITRLDAVIQQGQRAERELGFTDNWFHLIYGNSLREENGQNVATVFKSVQGIDAARKAVWGNSSFGLYAEPQRRPLERGADFSMSGDDSVEFKGGMPKTVEQHLSGLKWHGDRLSEHHLIASWNDVSRDPKLGEWVHWEGSGLAYNGEYTEFRARPAGLGQQGEPPEPLYLLLKLNPGKPFHGSVEMMSTDRDFIVAEHRKIIDMERHHDQTHRMTHDQWREQSFGMDRKQFT